MPFFPAGPGWHGVIRVRILLTGGSGLLGTELLKLDTGIEAPTRRNLKLTPYVLVTGRRPPTGDDSIQDDADAGVDLKYSITPSLTLDATYNTDFAQVEVDEQQVNLDRFSLFFPEKRPFFLENAGLFAVGDPGAVELFFSRRIGIGPSGQAIPILGGARLSGNIAGTSVGLLNMQTEAFGDAIPSTNYAVARVRRELPNRSSIGAIFTNKQEMGDLAPADDYNRVLAADGRLGLGANGLVNGFVARSFTPGMEGPQEAFQVAGRYDSEFILLDATYSQVGAGFNPEIGFLRRTSYRNPTGLVLMRFAFDSKEAKQLNKDIFETIYFAALTESLALAKEHGPYQTFAGSPASNPSVEPVLSTR